MDNFNALSKSAILTKLALDGYFIDLLTLNSFIKEWQIEAIYENEFGVEFFDNASYETIIGGLKEKHKKTKESFENNPKERQQTDPPLEITSVQTNAGNIEESFNKTVSIDDLSVLRSTHENVQKIPPEDNAVQPEIIKADTVSLDDIQDKIQNSMPKSVENVSSVPKPVVKNEATLLSRVQKIKETIMPMAMKRLTPSPVSPMSSLNLNHSYMEDDVVDEDAEYIEEYTEEFAENSSKTLVGEDLSKIIENESFSQEELEKADKLINNKTAALNSEPNIHNETKDELDLMQLAQTFAQNLTGAPTNAKDIPPAGLEEIFSGSYTEPFEELQDFVREFGDEENVGEYQSGEYASLQEDISLGAVIPVAQSASLMPKEMNTASLTAQDIRDIIRDEISKQTANVLPKPKNGEDYREIISEIVKQATEIAPQNAFKLDISHGTLDMIAKSIAKKIAIKLNSYYKLNSSKQNAKLQQFRERTIELKERNQTLAEENRKLKLQLTETKRILSAYKPSLFGLFKFTGKKRR